MRWISATVMLALALAPCLRAQSSSVATHVARPPAKSSSAANRFVVLLDPAHGGKDAGATLSDASAKVYSLRHLEKDATLDFAQLLRTALTNSGVAARLTRSGDATVPDSERAAQGSSLGAGVCITLHATAVGAGVHVFYPLSQFGLPNHTFLDQWAAADVAPSGQSRPLARALAAALNKAQIAATQEPATGPVISRERCAAVAIELAPLRTPGSAAVTAYDAQYQQRVATAVAQAIVQWRAQRQSLDAGAAAYARKIAR